MNEDTVYEVDTRVPLDFENNDSLSYDGFYEKLDLMPRGVHHIASRIADILLGIIEENLEAPCETSVFDMSRVPSIRLKDYVSRIATYSLCSPEVYIMAIIYIDRFHVMRQEICLKHTNGHK